ncbi:MAG: methionine synthase [Candidatus Hodgkinia cicadicola]
MLITEIRNSSVHGAITSIINKRIMVLDGAMGTQVQKYKLTNKHYSMGISSKLASVQLGNNDVLNITQPKLIEKIHADYLKAGCDIVETNTFSSNKISQLDYGMQNECDKLNKQGVLVAKRASLKRAFSANKRVFVAGSVGPTNKTASMSPNVLKPSYRAISFDELVLAYKQQIESMVRSKVDVILIETIFDTLNAKAAIYAYYSVCFKIGTKQPIMLSATISDNSGRTLSGQTVEAFWVSVEHAKPLCVGLNCALGADKLKPYVAQLSTIADVAVCAYPNAGLPNEFGEYDETAQQFANKIKDYIANGLVNIIGGCCGSSPQHIAMIKTLIAHASPRKPAKCASALQLSGIDSIAIQRCGFCKIGERANVTGSAKFKQLIVKGEYEKALDVIRGQLDAGARVLDVNVDEALLDSEFEMKKLVNLIGSEPDISRVPLMVDSSNWNTLIAGIKCAQGKCIVNSISLKEGEAEFLTKAQTIKMCGSVPIAIAFDELGQANTTEKRLQICNRAYRLLMRAGYKPQEVIFDLNTFAVATGLREHNNSAVELIKSIRLVTALFPKANISIGVSNLSFSFRGNSVIRESLHSVFLLHAVKAGLNLGIVNVNKQLSVSDLSPDIKRLSEQLIFNLKEFSVDEIVLRFSGQRAEQAAKRDEAWRSWSLKSRLCHAVVNGIEKYIEADSIGLSNLISPISIIEGPLMEGMNVVGKLFGSGKMFLPQVVKSARVMKKAVQALTPLLQKAEAQVTHAVLLATVKGDVHDIGKNIVGIVLSCNNYKIVDLGIMVPADEIVKTAIASKASVIGLSGLITPSLDEMVKVASELQERGVSVPLLIGGATTSKIHTAVKIHPKYSNGVVVHVANASSAVGIVSKLLSKNKQKIIANIRAEYDLIASAYLKSKLKTNKIKYSQVLSLKPVLKQKRIKHPNTVGCKLNAIGNFKQLLAKIDWGGCVAANIVQVEQNTSITQTKLTTKARALAAALVRERWFSIRCNVAISKANSSNQQILILDGNNNLIDKLPTLSQQHTDSAHLSLSDFVDSDFDYVSAFCCSASYESTLIQRFLKRSGKQQLASLLKSVCDTLIEKCSSCIYNRVRAYFWGFLDNCSQITSDGEKAGIRPAPGYPICPDHYVKLKLARLLNSKCATGLIINSKHLIVPQSSVIALIFANKAALYFSIKNVNADQVLCYSYATKLSTQNIEKALATIIGYIPSYIEQ